MTCRPRIRLLLNNTVSGLTPCSLMAVSYAPHTPLHNAAIPAKIGIGILNMSIPSASACARKINVMVAELHSSHGIRKPGSPNRNTPSMATHFINNHKLCSSASTRLLKSHARHDHNTAQTQIAYSRCVGASMICVGIKGSLEGEGADLKVGI